MGAWGSFNLLLAHPDLFAAAILFSGSTGASASQMKTLAGNSIRVYYGSEDRADLIQSITSAQANWVGQAHSDLVDSD
jgi:predicted peptidase